MVNQATADAEICPLCQAPNHCAQAKGSSDPCWCFEEHFPERLSEQLQRDGVRWCICKQCLQRAQGENHGR